MYHCMFKFCCQKIDFFQNFPKIRSERNNNKILRLNKTLQLNNGIIELHYVRKIHCLEMETNAEDYIVFIVLFLRHIKHVQSGVTYIPECKQTDMYSKITLATKPSTH